MKIKLVLSGAILFTGIAVMQAQDMNSSNSNGSRWWNSDSDHLYHANELDLDIYGTAASDWKGDNYHYSFHNRHDLGGGGGGGLDYFFNRYVGLEGEVFAIASRYNTAWAAGGNLMLRVPIGETGLAPYLLAGGGNEWTFHTEPYSDGGAGLEFRFCRHFGVFGDGRFVDPAITRNYGLGRLGFRFSF